MFSHLSFPFQRHLTTKPSRLFPCHDFQDLVLVVECLKPPVKALNLLLRAVVGELLGKDGVVGEVPRPSVDARTRIVKPRITQSVAKAKLVVRSHELGSLFYLELVSGQTNNIR